MTFLEHVLSKNYNQDHDVQTFSSCCLVEATDMTSCKVNSLSVK